MNCGCCDISGGIGPLLEGAEVSDEGDCRRRVPDVYAGFPHAVYTSEQMLEMHPKTAISAIFRDLRRGLQPGMLAQQRVAAS